MDLETKTDDKLVVFSCRLHPAVKKYIYDEAARLGVTITVVMEYLMEQSKKQLAAAIVENATVQEKIFGDVLLERLHTTVSKTDSNEALEIVLNMNDELVLENEKLRNREPETITKEVEVIKNVAISLEKNQFVCTLPEAESTKLRKCRKFMIQDGRIKQNAEPNDMMPMFVNYYLDNKYDHILNPLFR